MKTRYWLFLAILVFSGTASLRAEDVAGLPLHVQKLDSRAIRVWLGDFISSTAVVAIATKEGIVVIDTIGNPTVDRELRKVIARELGRNDFKYLINTHGHGDHTMGNPVYADCTIIAQERCAEGMRANRSDNQRIVEWYTTAINDLKKEIEKQPADSPEVKKLKEQLTLDELNLNVRTQKSGETLTFPTKTFADRMKLNLGDTTFELYYTGGLHSASDIAVFVPELGLLMTGDTMADVWLTDTPGCLASFMARNGVRHDFPLLLENWSLLLGRKDQIKDLIPGHWNGDLTLAGFENRYNYIKTLWEGINKAVNDGKSLEEVFAEYPLKTRFPELADSPGLNPRNHATTILAIWCEVTKSESAAARVYDLVNQGGSEDAIRKILAEREVKPAKYYFLEAEFNIQGYRFMQENKVPQAMVLFKLNADLYPQSWNVYDSLAEAYMQSGDNEMAVKLYEKSLQLNPDNKNAKTMLERIRAAGK